MVGTGQVAKRSSDGGSTRDSSTIKFVFLDRDGVINRKVPEGEYVTSWQDIQMLPGAERAIALLNRASCKVIVVTNQRGIALGRFSEPDLLSIHENLQKHLNSLGAHLDAIYFCPHDLGQCNCRKPGTGMFERAFHDFPEASPENSLMIGDSVSDMVAGTNLGMKTILITDTPDSGAAPLPQPTHSGRSLLEVVETYLSC
jgi:D-glycero-D-manno-heptose 1,7-bisphosphate phosphatase